MSAGFQYEVRKDKGRQLNEPYQHLDEVNGNGHTRTLFAEVKMMRFSFSVRKGAVRDRDGNELSDQKKIKYIWKEYKEELYASQTEHQENSESGQMDREPNILEEEVA